jgi:hypothetical protein
MFDETSSASNMSVEKVSEIIPVRKHYPVLRLIIVSVNNWNLQVDSSITVVNILVPGITVRANPKLHVFRKVAYFDSEIDLVVPPLAKIYIVFFNLIR